MTGLLLYSFIYIAYVHNRKEGEIFVKVKYSIVCTGLLICGTIVRGTCKTRSIRAHPLGAKNKNKIAANTLRPIKTMYQKVLANTRTRSHYILAAGIQYYWLSAHWEFHDALAFYGWQWRCHHSLSPLPFPMARCHMLYSSNVVCLLANVISCVCEWRWVPWMHCICIVNQHFGMWKRCGCHARQIDNGIV